MKLIVIAVAVLSVAACDTFDASKDIDFDNPALRTTVAKHGVYHPIVELTAIADFNSRTPEPLPWVAPWLRPNADEVLAEACPDAFRKEWVTHMRKRDTNELMRRYPHGIISCAVGVPPSESPHNAPGFRMFYVTPEPTGDYLPLPSPTPRPPSYYWTPTPIPTSTPRPGYAP